MLVMMEKQTLRKVDLVFEHCGAVSNRDYTRQFQQSLPPFTGEKRSNTCVFSNVRRL